MHGSITVRGCRQPLNRWGASLQQEFPSHCDAAASTCLGLRPTSLVAGCLLKAGAWPPFHNCLCDCITRVGGHMPLCHTGRNVTRACTGRRV
mmetsp:Transcript_41968/g.125658  ORF Transcript_41968/g.125658 Transcript_41968/m.125658 type:complete len:92 (-) Transcript_41968:524-799(-)